MSNTTLDTYIENIPYLTDDQLVYLVLRFGFVWGIVVPDGELLRALGKEGDSAGFKNRLLKKVGT